MASISPQLPQKDGSELTRTTVFTHTGNRATDKRWVAGSSSPSQYFKEKVQSGSSNKAGGSEIRLTQESPFPLTLSSTTEPHKLSSQGLKLGESNLISMLLSVLQC